MCFMNLSEEGTETLITQDCKVRGILTSLDKMDICTPSFYMSLCLKQPLAEL